MEVGGDSMRQGSVARFDDWQAKKREGMCDLATVGRKDVDEGLKSHPLLSAFRSHAVLAMSFPTLQAT